MDGNSTHMRLFADLVEAYRNDTITEDPVLSEVDVRYYTSPPWLAREKEALFRDQAIFVGPSSWMRLSS